MCTAGLCSLPDDALCRLFLLLDAEDLLAAQYALSAVANSPLLLAAGAPYIEDGTEADVIPA